MTLWIMFDCISGICTPWTCQDQRAESAGASEQLRRDSRVRVCLPPGNCQGLYRNHQATSFEIHSLSVDDWDLHSLPFWIKRCVNCTSDTQFDIAMCLLIVREHSTAETLRFTRCWWEKVAYATIFPHSCTYCYAYKCHVAHYFGGWSPTLGISAM